MNWTDILLLIPANLLLNPVILVLKKYFPIPKSKSHGKMAMLLGYESELKSKIAIAMESKMKDKMRNSDYLSFELNYFISLFNFELIFTFLVL